MLHHPETQHHDSSIVVKNFNHKHDSIPWGAIVEGALVFNAHLPAPHLHTRLEAVRSRVLENKVNVVVAYQSDTYAGHLFFSHQRPNIIRVALGGIDKNVMASKQAVLSALLEVLHHLDGKQDIVCGAPESMLSGFQSFLDEHGFKRDEAAKPTTLEIDQTFQDRDAESYVWFRKAIARKQ